MATAKQTIGKTVAGWPAEKLVAIYRLMYLSRRLDDKEITLKKQNKIFFQISGAGHEAVLVAAGLALRPGYDWFYPYYRDRGLVLALGMTPTEVLMEATGSAADPNSGGRQMPCHWGHKKLNVVNQSSPTGTQFLQAVGCAKATRYYAEVLGPEDRPSNFHPDEITYVSGGDGATSEGEFWEALNFASLYRLPVLFLIEDNDYAISVPKEFQTAGGSISKLVANFPSLFIKEVDGCDPLKSYEVIKEAERYIRSSALGSESNEEGRGSTGSPPRAESRGGPALVHAHVIRPYSHSLSDVQADYRSPKEIAEENARDPILTFANFLLKEKVLTEAELALLKEEVDAEIDQAADEALASPQPAPETAELYVYSPDIDPTSKEFESEPKFKEGTQPLTLVAAINTCLKEEMARNKKVLIYGEDVADCSRVESLSQVTGKGGVFKVTIGLQKAFGPERAFNSPLAEATIVGTAVGMATRGLKPVVEIQFFDYIWPAMMQIVNEWAKLRWRSNNANSSPAIIRVPFGGY
ncbi:MAG: thiamine pyrophosphate-dependent enzyme, partial [Limisphaerales bacterium]